MHLLLLLAAPFTGAFIAYLIGRRREAARDLFAVLLTLGVLLGTLLLYPALQAGPVVVHVPQLMGTGLDLRVGPLQYTLVLLTALIWFVGTAFLTQYVPARMNRNRFHFFYLLTFAGALGFFMADNILNQFTFFEILSLSAYFLIIHDEDDYAHEAGTLYVTMAIFGGLLVLMGILTAYEATGTLMLEAIARLLPAMETERTVVGALLFAGYAIKAGIFPLHVWLPKAYAAAPAPATVVLTGVLAKTGLYGLYTTLLLLTGGDPLFAWLAVGLGALTLLHGGLMALFQRNVKRLLAFSSMSQYGLVLAALGIAALSDTHRTEILTGAFLLMVSHSLYKALAFLSVGLLYLRVGDLSLNLIHGIGRRALPMMAALTFSTLTAWGLPGLSGYGPKTLVHKGMVYWAHGLPSWGFWAAEGLYILGSSLTVAYSLKLLTALLLDPPSEFSGMVWLKRQLRSYGPLALPGVLILMLGLVPGPLTGLIGTGLGHAVKAPGATLSGLESLLIPLSLGILIHLGLTRRFLRKAFPGEVVYVNPLGDGPSLETHVYGPVTGQLLSRTTALVTFLDSGLMQGAALTVRAMKKLDAALKPKPASAADAPEAPSRQMPALPAAEAPIPAENPMTAAPKAAPPPQTHEPAPHREPRQRRPAPSPKALLRSLEQVVAGSAGLNFALYLFGAFLVLMLVLMLFR